MAATMSPEVEQAIRARLVEMDVDDDLHDCIVMHARQFHALMTGWADEAGGPAPFVAWVDALPDRDVAQRIETDVLRLHDFHQRRLSRLMGAHLDLATSLAKARRELARRPAAPVARRQQGAG